VEGQTDKRCDGKHLECTSTSKANRGTRTRGVRCAPSGGL
jgi:hypothetical protein